jgi:Phage integrase family
VKERRESRLRGVFEKIPGSRVWWIRYFDQFGKKLRKVIEAKWPSHVPELDVAINTGIRKGSQYWLTWDMVDWEGRMLDIPRTKNEEAIHVPLNDAAIAALKVVHARGGGRGRVFQSEKTGEPLENGRH